MNFTRFDTEIFVKITGTRYRKGIFAGVFGFMFMSGILAQPGDPVFRQPLDLPVLLSGTFAELRANHFHSGIDFRTQGTEGHKVYACEQGYVSRIFVSPGGYGKALYIRHPNGFTTVYGHLDAFNGEIAEYVRQRQYRRERFAVDLYLDSTLFLIRRGDVIGFSGNTGGSGGPHLHFEVRETSTEKVINPMLFGFGVKDNVAPVIRRIAVYPAGTGSTVNGSPGKLILPVEKVGKDYRIAGNRKLHIKGQVAFGIDAYDQVSGSANRCGPYSIKLWADSTMFFSQTMNKFSFDESRYINSLVDYAYYREHRVFFNRLYIEKNNQLSVYDRHVNRGVISFADSSAHQASIMVSDLHGNNSVLNFSFVSAPCKQAIATATLPAFLSEPVFKTGNSLKKETVFNRPGIKVVIPANALYDEIDFEYHVSNRPENLYSEVYYLHDAGTPLHKAITIGIAADSLPERLRGKALLVQIDRNGRRTSAGGAYKDGMVSVGSTVFGSFAIGVDTVPPRITPVNIKKGANMRGIKNIRVKIKDDFSGIGSYNGWIDNRWALFEYDAKNDLIFYDFDAGTLSKNTKHILKIEIKDNKNNIATYQTDFFW
jgi:hypothetical protein